MDETEIAYVKKWLSNGPITLEELNKFYKQRFGFYPTCGDLAYMVIEDGIVKGIEPDIDMEEWLERTKKLHAAGISEYG